MGVAVGSSLLSPILPKKAVHLAILGTASGLTWLNLDGLAVTVQLVANRAQPALPTSIFVQSPADLAPERFGLIDGRLALGDRPIEISRWWQPPRVRESSASSSSSRISKTPNVELLLGSGIGLTPEGDDLLAGWLVMARAIGHPALTKVQQKVRLTAASRTTLFSARLLECASEGFGVAPLVAYVDALTSNSNTTQANRESLVRVGHSSGAALAKGVEMAFGIPQNGSPAVADYDKERVCAQ
ncbi:MAG TPA: DUF2877 domain-containing protein [Candidatus Nanopelagicaceae bacterium]|nr:DUF2877 domain-containing protein [Candidatus Nanopelagicaceae bacterium]